MIVQTFAQIEEIKGIHYDKNFRHSPLSDWYDSVREKRFSDFSVEDWCKCVRQDMFLEYVIAYALAELRRDPLAGEMYDGELANALLSVKQDFWVHRDKEREELKTILRAAYDH
jgi:hypothetical protein